MNQKRFFPLIVILWLVVPCFAVTADDQGDEIQPDNEVGIEAIRILSRNCGRCHKGGSSSFFDARSASSMVEEGYVSEEDHEGSILFERMFEGSMPPKNRPQLPRPSGEEMEIVKQWINQGAVQPTIQPRVEVSRLAELQGLLMHLAGQSTDKLANIRFFSFRNLHNDPEVDDQQLLISRIALAKTLNSTSWETGIVSPVAVPIGAAETILYAVDISQLGWTRKHWDTILKHYPYAVGYDGHPNEQLDELDRRIENIRGSKEPIVIRADWFISVATKPPVYHRLVYDLTLPSLSHRRDSGDAANPKAMTDLDLENYLGLDVTHNIRTGIAKRSGFTESGVSGQNRLIERHPLPRGGAYWKSYDFKGSNRTAILSEFPAGPRFDKHPFPDLAFEHDGGEIIFNLPNGLQAYLLIDAEGNRIDAGPIEVVADSLKTSGNEQIVSGVSCIACHRTGMIDSPVDEVRQFASLAGEAKRFVRSLYPEVREMNRGVENDRNVFLKSLRQVSAGVDQKVDVESLPEPVGEVARRYFLDPMTIQTVAAELDLTVPELKTALQHNDTLQAIGLRVLLREGGSIKRAAWESPAAFPMMKEVAREFGFSPRE